MSGSARPQRSPISRTDCSLGALQVSARQAERPRLGTAIVGHSRPPLSGLGRLIDMGRLLVPGILTHVRLRGQRGMTTPPHAMPSVSLRTAHPMGRMYVRPKTEQEVLQAAYGCPMRRLGRVIAVAAIAVTGSAAPSAASAAKPSASRAATAVERQVADKYGYVIEDRSVTAACRKSGRNRYRCTYRVFANADDGFEAGMNGEDIGPYIAKGSAYAYVRKGGGYRVAAYAPRWL